MQTITEYVVRKPVTILGKNYAPGDRIDDPNIKPGVLATLVNTKRIGTQVRVQTASTTVDIPESEVRADIEQSVAGAGAPDPVEPEQSPLLKAWRAQYDSEPHGRGGTFRNWMCQQASNRKLRSNGSNEEIVARLDLAGFKPGGST
jgi:hypothetical protein